MDLMEFEKQMDEHSAEMDRRRARFAETKRRLFGDDSQDKHDVTPGELAERASAHWEILQELWELYTTKNADYGNSFHDTWIEEGPAMVRIRLTDKLNRFKQLTQTEAAVKGESIRDTLLDLANYAIMTVMEMDAEKGAANND